MVSKEHKLVVKVLSELAEAYGEYDKVVRNKRVDTLQDYDYKPDLWAVTKRGEIDVCEVWYGESDASAVANIFWSALIPNIRNLCIVCIKKRYKNPWTEVGATEIFDIVSKHVNKDKKSAQHYLHYYVAEITEDDLKDYEKMKKHLKARLAFTA